MDKDRQVLPLVRQATRLEAEGELALLFRREQPMLVRYAARLSDPEQAEDIVQDALLKFLAQRRRERDRADDREGEHPWAGLGTEDARLRLTVMVRDVALDRTRLLKKESRMMRLITGPSATVRRWMSARRAVDNGVIRSAIHAALLLMDPSLREPWLLVHDAGFTYKEVAQLLGSTPASIRANVSKANAFLRDYLRREGITPSTLRGRDDE